MTVSIEKIFFAYILENKKYFHIVESFFFKNNEIKLVLKDVRDAMSNILDKTTLSDLIERACSGPNMLNYVI